MKTVTLLAPADIRTVCCVCQVHLGGDPTAPHVSHGYCPTHLREFYEEMARMNAEALGS